MGWRDRDYARFSESERRVFYGTGPATRASRYTATGTATRATGVAIAVSLALLLAGQFPQGHPLIPPLHFAIPARAASALPGFLRSHRHLPLTLPATAQFASHLRLTGTASGQHGTVTADESLDGTTWTQVGAASIDNTGRFQLTVRYISRGLVHLRLRYPNGDTADGTLTVH